MVTVCSKQVRAQRCAHANNLVQTIQKNHVQPIATDNRWSLRVFNGFFNELDPYHLYFTQLDTAQFTAQRTELDDLVHNQEQCKWTASVTELFKKRIAEYKLWLEQSLSKPYNYQVADQFDGYNFPPEAFSPNTSALEVNRIAYFKFLILNRMFAESLADSAKASLLVFEELARKKVKVRELQKIADLEGKGFSNYADDAFLQAIAKAFDPHTNYMSVTDHENFKDHLRDETLSFGFSLGESESGLYRIENVLPGGPAWNSNNFQEGDFLLAFETPAKGTLSSMDYELDDLEDLISSNEIQEATFTLRKTDGQIQKVTLRKEKMRSIENTVSGYVLKGSKTIGYIPLPSFYFSRNETSQGGCASDVASAIIKLNKEKIEGLILDLRFNGGGSMDEARELAGIFIDFGPIIMVQDAKSPVAVLKDSNKGTIYNGPLMIMVNGFSASASELLASSLQDYKRALIVGGHTFGKGTGQSVLPLPSGGTNFAKVTTLKIYRINGKTYQHKGVTPDISLPDITQFLDRREANYPTALPGDSIPKKAYYTPAPQPAFTTLAEKSKQRVQQSAQFKNIELWQHQLIKPIPLDVAGFTTYASGFALNKKSDPLALLTIHNTSFDNSLLAFDPFRKTLNEKSIQQLRESFYIQEAYNIMLDYISLTKK